MLPELIVFCNSIFVECPTFKNLVALKKKLFKHKEAKYGSVNSKDFIIPNL